MCGCQASNTAFSFVFFAVYCTSLSSCFDIATIPLFSMLIPFFSFSSHQSCTRVTKGR
jgi:hypothetical protein